MTPQPFMIHLPVERLKDLEINALKDCIKRARVTDIMLRLYSFQDHPTPGIEVRQFMKWCSANNISMWYCRAYWPLKDWSPEHWNDIFNPLAYNLWANQMRQELNGMWAVGRIVADFEPYAKENWANVFESQTLAPSMMKALQKVLPGHRIDGIIPIMERANHFSHCFRGFGTHHFRQETRYVNSPKPVLNILATDWFQHCVTPTGKIWSTAAKTWMPDQIASIISQKQIKVLIYTDTNTKTDIVDVLEGVAEQWT